MTNEKLTFVSFASMETRQVLGAIIVPFPDGIEFLTSPVEPDSKDARIMKLGMFYNHHEMNQMGYVPKTITGAATRA